MFGLSLPSPQRSDRFEPPLTGRSVKPQSLAFADYPSLHWLLPHRSNVRTYPTNLQPRASNRYVRVTDFSPASTPRLSTWYLGQRTPRTGTRTDPRRRRSGKSRKRKAEVGLGGRGNPADLRQRSGGRRPYISALQQRITAAHYSSAFASSHVKLLMRADVGDGGGIEGCGEAVMVDGGGSIR